jgi:rsbT co-antagonist protein RsbR
MPEFVDVPSWPASERIAAERVFPQPAEAARHRRDTAFEFSVPVINLWAGILVVPVVGTLDSRRAQELMDELLSRISSERTSVVIIDITGVPAVDTLVAQHLLQTVAAARLMGAECIISGLRPNIADDRSARGVDLIAVRTKATLGGALALAFQWIGVKIA